MLRWLKINRYRNVVPGTELRFSDGHHVLLGPNGGGKTTLLELIAAVLRGDFSGMKEEEFSLEYSLVDGEYEMNVAVHHERVRSPTDATGHDWRDALEVSSQHPKLAMRRLAVHEGRFSLDGEDTSSPVLDILRPRLHGLISLDFWEALIPAHEALPFTAWFGIHRFDEALEFFSFLRGNRTVYGKPQILIVHRQARLDRHPSHPLFKRASQCFFKGLSAFPSEDVDRISIPLASLGILDAVVGLLGFRSGLYQAELEHQDLVNEEERRLYERFQFRFIRRDGTMVRDEHLSFGQKRLLAFLFYAWANDGPIVADELVDGMHHRWVEHCLKAIQGRQAFLSSQNPLLMDFMGFDSAEKVEQTFVICDLEERDGRERMRWRNLTADEGREFFDAYEVGIQHVSEILRDKGLW